MEVSNETKTAADIVQDSEPGKTERWHKNPESCSVFDSNRTHNSLLCAPCRALIDMRNAYLGLFTPESLKEFLSTMNTHNVANVHQLIQLAQDRNAYQLLSLAKRMRVYERDAKRNMFPRLLQGLQGVSDYTAKAQAAREHQTKI